MRRNILSIILLASCATSAQAVLDSKIISDKTYACISAAPLSGYSWNGNKWEAKRFSNFEKFLLNVTIIEDISSKQKYLHFNLKSDSEERHCGTLQLSNDLFANYLSCMQYGISVIFSEESERGGLSYLLGSVSKEETRDSLAVMPFTCQKF